MGSSSQTSNHVVNGSKFDKSVSNQDYNYSNVYNIEKHTGINQSGDYVGGSKLNIGAVRNNAGHQCFGMCLQNLMQEQYELENLGMGIDVFDFMDIQNQYNKQQHLNDKQYKDQQAAQLAATQPSHLLILL